MPIPFDLDLPIFLWSTLKIVFGSKSRLRQSSRPIPLRFEFEELLESQLTPIQLEYLKPTDAQLARLNYKPLSTFRAKNYGTNLLRRYVHPSDTASCALTVVEVRANVEGVSSVRNSSHLEFATRTADGKLLITRNMSLKSLFDQPPYRVVQECPNVTEAAELKKRHDARARSLGVPLPPPQQAAAVFEELNIEHERYSKSQVESGVYQLAPGGGAYLVTDKVFDRGIRNHFLPFGRKVSPTYALFSALIGAVLPLFGILKLAPWLVTHTAADPSGFSQIGLVAILACYCLAGLIIGYVCEFQKLTWMMLVTYVPAHLVAGWSFGWFPYTTAAFLCAYMASQARQRAKLVLQT